MALIKCSDCGKKISNKAKACPNCGCPINEKEEKNKKKSKQIKIIAAKCPNCGSNIEVNSDDNKTKCIYCNSTIIVDDAIERLRIELNGEIEVNNLPKKNNLIKIAERAYQDKDYEKALDNYTKALAIDPDDWKAIYKEGICTAKISTIGDFNLDKAINSSRNALKILIEKKTPQKDISSYKIEMAKDLLELCIAYFDFALNHYQKYWELNTSAKKFWQQLLVVRDGSKFVAEVLVNEDAISMCPKNSKGESSKDYRLLALKEVVLCDVTLCEPKKYKTGYNKYGDVYTYTSVNSSLRNELVNEYDSYVKLIKKEEPDYTPSEINWDGKTGGCYIATCYMVLMIALKYGH